MQSIQNWQRVVLWQQHATYALLLSRHMPWLVDVLLWHRC